MSEKVLHEWVSESGRKFRMLIDGSIRLGSDKGPMLLSGWEPCFARELARLAAENANLRAALAEAREAMMEPHGEWKDVREAKALVASREALEEK